MKASFDHVKINVSDTDFYRELLTYLGFRIVKEHVSGFGATDGRIDGVWVSKAPQKYIREINFQTTGLNHLAFNVESKEEVDKFYKDYLVTRKISVLHEPKEYPQYVSGYYAVFFEDPDHIKLEVVYKP